MRAEVVDAPPEFVVTLVCSRHEVTKCQEVRKLKSIDNASEAQQTLFFFFFQAEDGIRDLTVTGVQTCALPISEAAAVRTTACTSRTSAQRAIKAGRRATMPFQMPRAGSYCGSFGRNRSPRNWCRRAR